MPVIGPAAARPFTSTRMMDSFSGPLRIESRPARRVHKGFPCWRCGLVKTTILGASRQRSRRLALPLLELGHELLDRLIRLGMAAHLREKLRRHGQNVGAGLHRLIDVRN